MSSDHSVESTGEPLPLADALRAEYAQAQTSGVGFETMPLHASLMAQAREIVVSHRRGSISLVQRHMRIGYNSAARMIEQMEREGLLSPMNSMGVRTYIGGTT